MLNAIPNNLKTVFTARLLTHLPPFFSKAESNLIYGRGNKFFEISFLNSNHHKLHSIIVCGGGKLQK